MAMSVMSVGAVRMGMDPWTMFMRMRMGSRRCGLVMVVMMAIIV